MKKLTIYLTFMYPNEKDFYNTLDMLDNAGVDVIEFGIPVSNPYMDGEIIQNSHKDVLKNGLTVDKFHEHMNKIRERYNFEIGLMTYKEGLEYFELTSLKSNLYDGILCVDDLMTTREVSNLIQLFNEEMTMEELSSKLKNTTHFAYVMSGVGKTGSFNSVPTGYQLTIPILKKLTDRPIYVGFGISSPQDVKEVCRNGADGVIIGSKFMQILNENGLLAAEKYILELKDSL